MKIRTFALAVITCAAVSGQAAPTTVVDFSGDYGMTGFNPTGPWGALYLSGTNGSFSDTTAISPADGTPSRSGTPSETYSIPSGRNGVFYGGWEITGTTYEGTTDYPSPFVRDYSGPDGLSFQALGTGNSADPGGTYAGLYLINKTDFLNGADSQTVSLDNTSSFAAIQGSDFNADSREWRVVVELDDSNYYISSATAGDGGAITSAPLQTVNFSSLTWESYDPTSGIVHSSGAAYAGLFSNVTAIGIYSESTRNTGEFTLRNSVLEFSAEVTAIPEPGTLALFGIAGLTLAVTLRRRR